MTVWHASGESAKMAPAGLRVRAFPQVRDVCGRGDACRLRRGFGRCKQVSLLHFQSARETPPLRAGCPGALREKFLRSLQTSDSRDVSPTRFQSLKSWGLISQGQVLKVEVGHVGFEPFVLRSSRFWGFS